MTGIPVTISDRGIPVRPVEANAPVMTATDNGLGVPIVISELGSPFIVDGLLPDIPTNTALPTVSGTAQVAETLTADPGTWDPAPDSYAYQWQRGTTNITGATSSTYAPVEADIGQTLRVQVIAANAGGDSDPAYSAATAAVIAAFSAPVNTVAPSVSGTTTVGETLTSTNGTWTGNPTATYTRAWQRSADGSAGWADIAGATAITYVLVEADESQYIRMVVTGTNSEGSSTANSNSVGPVAALPVESPFAAFTVEAGTGNDGDTGYYSTIYGGVSAEPLAGFPLLEFSTRNANYTQVAFTGDCLTTVSGWVPVIDGVTIGAAISDWAFDGEYTSGTWESTGAMVENASYPITWTKD